MTRLFLVGAGFIAREHANAAFDQRVIPGEVELHVTDSNSAVLDDFVDHFPQAIAHPDATTMFDVPRRAGDIAVIATPPVSHHALVLQALDAGLHVLCEKPLMMTSAEAADVEETARVTGLVLECCDIRFDALPATQQVRRVIADGTIGSPYHVTFVNTAQRARTGFDHLAQSGWFRDPSVSGGGVMMDWGPYDIAVLDEVLRPVRVEIVHAWASAPRTGGPFEEEATRLEQHVGAAMVLEDGDGTRVPVTYERAAATHGEERSTVQVEGSDGAVTWDWLDWMGDGSVRLSADSAGAPTQSTTSHPLPEVGFHARPLARMVGLVDGGRMAPEEAVAVTDAAVFRFDWVRAVLECAETGRPVTVMRAPQLLAQGVA
ncbi:Gfo/Idh/MocA family oxidoreductase [Herbiconiux sp. KACC 21604]|uniref:Gfo/Idh/MocA family protein n=1 Tax=unclassified Herbiconiux TaxID=2618217 RepID=UPI0014918A7E|nr:Gfo/Idh/MocA family oxidoreductase [Herbiconiux sp. SALV-R1]QJU55232.1 Gfo/Idh/MocA family oxidoreductase [Herbiconiux sp. SALV-R1]WPO86398.1 Gfo/Idh/MocA family oxidoreductase [Herbiconiux sp. KACC 21604]